VRAFAAQGATNALTGGRLPPEVFGLAGMAGGEMMLDNRHFVVGSGAFTVDKAAERFGLKGSLQQVMS
jgi:hypothetical protein